MLIFVAPPEDYWEQFCLPDLEVLETFRLGIPAELSSTSNENSSCYPFWRSAEIVLESLPECLQTLQIGLPETLDAGDELKDQIRRRPWKSLSKDWVTLLNLQEVVIYTDYLFYEEECFVQVDPWLQQALTRRMPALVERNMLKFHLP
jgi:hypothetical protein